MYIITITKSRVSLSWPDVIHEKMKLKNMFDICAAKARFGFWKY
jgi:hypothetical protein